MRIGFKRIKPIDLFSEDFLFGHRLYLGELANEDMSEIQRIKSIIKGLHDIDIKERQISKIIPYYVEILKGLEHWSKLEKQLEYKPTPEEKRAGIDRLSKKLDSIFLSADSIVLRLGMQGYFDKDKDRYVTPQDLALKMPYTQVFKMLLKDTEVNRYERRRDAIHQEKWKNK